MAFGSYGQPASRDDRKRQQVTFGKRYKRQMAVLFDECFPEHLKIAVTSTPYMTPHDIQKTLGSHHDLAHGALSLVAPL
jgi:hypothetical protein